MLKTFRVVAMLAVLMALASPAWAGSINIIFDPQPPQVGNFYIIDQQGVGFQVAWGSCSQAGVPQALQGDDACMLFINESGAPITDINLTFTVPNDPGNPLIGSEFSCTSLDAFLSSNSCPGGTLQAGQTVTADFFGGMSVGNFSAFFLAENGIPVDDLPPGSVQAAAFDPNTMAQLAAGMALLAAFAMRRAVA